VALHRHHCRPRRESQGQDSEQYNERKRLQGVFKARAKHDREVFLNNLCDELETDVWQNLLGPAFKAIRLLSGKRKEVTSTTTSAACCWEMQATKKLMLVDPQFLEQLKVDREYKQIQKPADSVVKTNLESRHWQNLKRRYAVRRSESQALFADSEQISIIFISGNEAHNKKNTRYK